MSTLVLLNARTFAAGADLTGAANRTELTCDLADKDATNYASKGFKEVLGGLFDTSFSAAGQWEAGDPGKVDNAMWATVTGRSTVPWTWCPVSADVGGLAWHTVTLTTSYKLGGAVGDIASWEASGKGSAPLLRGMVAHPPGTPRAASGAGASLQLGALADGQRLFANLHVLSIAGAVPTFKARVESAATVDFDEPTTRATFAAVAERGGQAAAVLGPVDDEWWRIAWEVDGTDPSVLFMAAFGVA